MTFVAKMQRVATTETSTETVAFVVSKSPSARTASSERCSAIETGALTFAGPV